MFRRSPGSQVKSRSSKFPHPLVVPKPGRLAAATAAALLLLGTLGTAASAAPVGVTVIIQNPAPENGTWLTPTWVGFHDGTFDTHNLGQAASTQLEPLAEDGNTGPMSDLFDGSGAGTTQATIASDTGIPQIGPGETATMKFILDSTDPKSAYFSIATMVIPSNDAFIGNDDPQSHRIFDSSGNFLGAYFVIAGSEVKDAGTEVNDEIPEHTAFFGQTVPDSGVDENGVVHAHPGYLPPGSGGILDDPMFADADFTQPGYEVARVIIVRSDTVVDGGPVSGTWTAANSPYLVEGDATVPSGQTLTIQPGVIVYFTSWYALQVQGSLEALGTEADPILFTSTPHGPGEPAWRGVRFEDTSEPSLMEWCTIENGHVAGTTHRGGAIAAINASPVIRHCTMRNGVAGDEGAAVYLENSDAVIEDCTIEDNRIDESAGGAGAGIAVSGGSPQILDNLIRNNLIQVSDYFSPAGAGGGGIALFSSNALVQGNRIVNNLASAVGANGSSSRGGGIFCRSGACQFINNTLDGNSVNLTATHHEGGGFYFYYGAPVLRNNIVTGSTGGGAYFETSILADVGYSDFHGNDTDFIGPSIPTGLGDIVMVNANGDPCDAFYNIFLDPLYVDAGTGDYHLQAGSPCIDAGDPSSPPDPDGTVADIGAFYFPQGTSGVGGTSPSEVAARLQLLQNWPEPFRAGTDIHYDLAQPTSAQLTLYDVAGRALRTLVDGSQTAGEHAVHFDGRDGSGRRLAPGVYFYRLSTPAGAASRKMTRIR